jgi:hypothetical protein
VQRLDPMVSFENTQPEVLDAITPAHQLCAVREHLPMTAKKEVRFSAAACHPPAGLGERGDAGASSLQVVRLAGAIVQLTLNCKNACALSSRRCRKRSGSNVPWPTSRTWLGTITTMDKRDYLTAALEITQSYSIKLIQALLEKP